MSEVVNYREFFKVRLDDLNRQKEELDKEIRRAGTIISGLNEADRDSLRTDLFSHSGNGNGEIQKKKTERPSKEIVIECFRSSGKMMKTAAVIAYAVRERKISKQSINYALNKLLENNVLFRDEDKLWGLVGRSYSTSSDGQ